MINQSRAAEILGVAPDYLEILAAFLPEPKSISDSWSFLDLVLARSAELLIGKPETNHEDAVRKQVLSAHEILRRGTWPIQDVTLFFGPQGDVVATDGELLAGGHDYQTLKVKILWEKTYATLGAMVSQCFLRTSEEARLQRK